jgi:hypothetical protein
MPDPPNRQGESKFPVHVPIPCRVKVQAQREGTPLLPGQLRNIGEGGALLDFGRRVPPGAMLLFRVEMRGGLSEVEAEVLWTSPGPPSKEGPTWTHGLKFPTLEGGAPDPVIESLVRFYARATFVRPETDRP